MTHLLALALVAGLSQDAAGPGPVAPPSKPKARVIEPSTGGGSGTKPVDTPPPAPIRTEDFGEWRDTHRVTLRNGNTIDGILDEKASTDEGIVMKYSPTTETLIRYIDIAKDADGKYMIHKITMREFGTQKQLVQPTPKDPKGRDDGTGRTEPRVDPDPIKQPTPTAFSKEVKERAEAFLAALPNEPKKQEWVEKFSKSGQDTLMYTASQLPALNPSIASYCLAAFGKSKDARVLQEVRNQLSIVKDPQVLVAIINLFGYIDDKKSMGAIAKLANHPDETVRFAVVDMSAKLGDRREIEMLAPMHGDENPQVRQRSSEVLVELAKQTKAERDALNALRSALRKAKAEGAAVIAHSLGQLGLTDAVQPLIDLTMSPTVVVRLAAVTALGKVKTEQGVERLHTMVNTEKDKEVRAQVVESLITVGNKRSTVITLINALKNEKENSIQNTISRALATLTGHNAGSTYAEWKAWLDNRPREDQ